MHGLWSVESTWKSPEKKDLVVREYRYAANAVLNRAILPNVNSFVKTKIKPLFCASYGWVYLFQASSCPKPQPTRWMGSTWRSRRRGWSVNAEMGVPGGGVGFDGGVAGRSRRNSWASSLWTAWVKAL